MATAVQHLLAKKVPDCDILSLSATTMPATSEPAISAVVPADRRLGDKPLAGGGGAALL
jgi:hypothetical protein